MCLKEIGPFGMKISTVDFIKHIAVQCGWNGVKDAKNRKFLSDLKDLLTQWDETPFKKTCEVIRHHKFHLSQFDLQKKGVVFIFSREPEDIQKYVNKFNAKTVLIRRDSVENQEQSNHADSKVLDFNYDYEINNNGNLLELEVQVARFLDFFDII